MMKQLPEFATQRIQHNVIKSNLDSKKNVKKLKLELSGKTDYYGFFLWYSAYFLKEGGRLCFIIPNKWMDVKYGEKLKPFLWKIFRFGQLLALIKIFLDPHKFQLQFSLQIDVHPKNSAKQLLYNLFDYKIKMQFHLS